MTSKEPKPESWVWSVPNTENLLPNLEEKANADQPSEGAVAFYDYEQIINAGQLLGLILIASIAGLVAGGVALGLGSSLWSAVKVYLISSVVLFFVMFLCRGIVTPKHPRV